MADDSETFDRSWKWTKTILQRKEDHLFSWQFDYKRSWISFPIRIIRVEDHNSATDADTDIAYALFLAGEKWGRRDYIIEGKGIIADIWEKETGLYDGRRYVIAGNWANTDQGLVINPSYFSPQAYRVFAKYDPVNDWNKLAEDSYDILSRVSNLPGRGGLPPNWVLLDKSGEIRPYQYKQNSADSSYDAFRVFYRVALDQKKTPNFKAYSYLSSYKGFEDQFKANGKVCTLYYFQGDGFRCDENTTGMVGPLSVFSVTSDFYSSQLVGKYYVHDGKLQFPDYSYYAKSWHWFGLSLWAK